MTRRIFASDQSDMKLFHKVHHALHTPSALLSFLAPALPSSLSPSHSLAPPPAPSHIAPPAAAAATTTTTTVLLLLLLLLLLHYYYNYYYYY